MSGSAGLANSASGGKGGNNSGNSGSSNSGGRASSSGSSGISDTGTGGATTTGGAAGSSSSNGGADLSGGGNSGSNGGAGVSGGGSSSSGSAGVSSGGSANTGGASGTAGSSGSAGTGAAAGAGASAGTGAAAGAGAGAGTGGCTAGDPCYPSDVVCQDGKIDCSSGAAQCRSTGFFTATGTTCATDKVCAGGNCIPCVAGGSCTLSDPCTHGQYSCQTGVQVCVAGSPALDGQACGLLTSGSCQSGACTCPANHGYYQGDCQSCPASSTTFTRYVDPVNGVDNQCCGGSAQKGFGGPCRTLSYVLAQFASTTNLTVQYISTGAAFDAASEERYPIDLPDTQLTISGSGACFPGVSGKPVFRALHPNRTQILDQLTIGVSSKGVSRSATDGVYIGSQAQLTFGVVTISGTVNGVHVDGGSATMKTSNASLTIDKVSNDGILCRSDTDPTKTSNVHSSGAIPGYDTIYIHGTGQHGFFAGKGCQANVARTYIGYPEGSAGCPTRGDRVGVYAESNALFSMGGGSIVQCTTADGILAKTDPPAPPNAASVQIYASIIRHAGCAGIRGLTTNAVAVAGTAFNLNYWGIVQQSSQTSASAWDWQVNATGGSYPSANTFRCNGNPEPGECCTGSGCGGGGDFWNNSGLPLPAPGNNFTKNPPAACLCNEALSSCNCSGWALGLTTPPAALNILLSPYQGSANPSVDVSNYSIPTNPQKCE